MGSPMSCTAHKILLVRSD